MGNLQNEANARNTTGQPLGAGGPRFESGHPDQSIIYHLPMLDSPILTAGDFVDVTFFKTPQKTDRAGNIQKNEM